MQTKIYLCRLSFLLFIRFISNCTVHWALQFFYFFAAGICRRKINPAKITTAPNPCIIVSFSPSSTPQMIATTGISKVTVEANSGVETLKSL